MVDLAGTRIATLAYSAVFPHGYEARAGYPGPGAGASPYRLHALGDQRVEPRAGADGSVPSRSPRIWPPCAPMWPRPRGSTMWCVVSVHWGDFTRPFVLTDHERRVAHAAVDAGADVVLGHHHHMLRGVEFYHGKPIFYGLGHYLFDLPNLPARIARDGYLGSGDPADQRALARRFGEYRLGPREGYPLLPFHQDSRMTGMAVITLRQGTVDKVGFRPALIDPENNPQHLQPESAEGQRVLAYLQRCCDEEGLPTQVMRGVRPGSSQGLCPAGGSGRSRMSAPNQQDSPAGAG